MNTASRDTISSTHGRSLPGGTEGLIISDAQIGSYAFGVVRNVGTSTGTYTVELRDLD